MPLFTLIIDEPQTHFGEMQHQERAIIAQVLQSVAQSIGDGKTNSGPVMLSGHRVVGSFTYEPSAAR
jgi:hypothetical protein